MKEGLGSRNLSIREERSRGLSGGLNAKKKSDEMRNRGSSGKEKVFIQSKVRKRPRLILMSESESEDEDSLISPPNNVGSGDGEDKNRKLGNDKNKFIEAGNTVKRSKIDDTRNSKDEKLANISFKDGVEERRTEITRSGVLISKTDDIGLPKDDKLNQLSLKDGVEEKGNEIGRNAQVLINKKNKKRELETDNNRNIALDKRDGSDFGRSSNVSVELEREPVGVNGCRFHKNEAGNIRPGLPREKHGVHHGEPISVQGKIGVSKVMHCNKKNMGGHEKKYSLKNEEERRKVSQCADYPNGKARLSLSTCSHDKLNEKSNSVVATHKKQMNSVKKVLIKPNEDRTQTSEGSLLRQSKDVVTYNSNEVAVNKKHKTSTPEPCISRRHKEGEVKPSSRTEKQLLRDQIRQMLVNADWKIDLRPRRSRDYQDSVYISPSGTEHWSITKAYYAFQKQFNVEGDQKHSGDSSSFTPISKDILSKLTRKTSKKIEREMKMQNKIDRGSKITKEISEKKLKNHVIGKTDSGISDDNTIPRVMQDGKSLKARKKVNNVVGLNTDAHTKSTKSSLSKASCGNGVSNKQRGRGLLVRSSSRGMNMGDNDYVPYTGKRTMLSWMIDMGTIRVNGKVQYMNKKRTRAMLEGWITRDGIHCRCCSKNLTLSMFGLHAGSKLSRPFQNIIVEDGVSLYQCQLNAWNRLDKYVRLGFHLVDINGDPNDDTCGICGDGGDLICCDGCPSTFHQSCLDIQMLPPGDWLCPNCSCKFCHRVEGSTIQEEDKTLYSCSLCEKKYHRLCRQPAASKINDSDGASNSFCGKTCEELFQQLQKLLGVKHDLDAGFSWTLIQRSNLDSNASSCGQWLMTECNSKIAVALTVMDECFLPVIDRRSGINLIHNVLFNIGSNFNRLNYSGFYTVVLERGDEIISAASIRIRGTNLAEMPFIGTRHIYRRQGMCRRLLLAIESALCALNVEKLVIPAISELMHTWTTVFGFKPLEESHRQEVKTLSILVFPSTDLLQKPLLKHQFHELDVAVVKAIDPNGNSHIMPARGETTDICPVVPDTCSPANAVVSEPETSDVVSFTKIGPRSLGGSPYDSFDEIDNPIDTSFGTTPDVPSDCPTSETKFRPLCDTNLDSNTCSVPMELRLQIAVGDRPHELNLDGSSVEIDPHPSNEAFVPNTTKDNSDQHISVSGNRFMPTYRTLVQCNSVLSEQNVNKLESGADLCSVKHGIYVPSRSDVYNHEINSVANTEFVSRGLTGSKYDPSDMVSKPLDAALALMPCGTGEESAADTVSHTRCLGHDVESDAKIKPIFGSSVQSEL